ncbi:MAG: thioredoxin [Spirochaetota bacterium]|nr:thioredoxin [Spirochaetota bacterium]
MAGVLEVNDFSFDNEVLGHKGKVLVDFWAPWCGPCRMQAPILERIAQSGEVDAKITKVNTDESRDIAARYNIQSIPTLIIFDNGKEIERLVGTRPEDELKEKLK